MTGLHAHGSPTPPFAGEKVHASRFENAAAPPSIRDTERTPHLTLVDVVVVDPAELDKSKARSRWLAIYEPVKYAFDFVFGLILLVVFSPFIAIAALGVRATSAGPAFYSQTRAGKDGRLFRIFKLRTMVHNCERISGAKWSVPGDPRITPLGAFLRKTHIDELPQLLNVLRGEMSLVGPRPERPEIIATLEDKIPRYRERLAIRPGVTGLAQLRLPADTTIESVRQKLNYDLRYIEVIGPWLDIRLAACTLLKMCKLPMDFALALLCVPGDRTLPTAKPDLTAEPA